MNREVKGITESTTPYGCTEDIIKIYTVTEVGDATITILLKVQFFSVITKHFLTAGSLTLISVVSSLCDKDGGYAVYRVYTGQSSRCSD